MKFLVLAVLVGIACAAVVPQKAADGPNCGLKKLARFVRVPVQKSASFGCEMCLDLVQIAEMYAECDESFVQQKLDEDCRSKLQGLDGKAGPRGEKGVDAEKPIGLKGPRGVPGEQGDEGDEGPKGKDGAVGKPGPQGPQGPPGGQGPAGQDGEEGPAGGPGAPGADANYCPCPDRNRGGSGSRGGSSGGNSDSGAPYRRRLRVF
uniref:Uncharacterized protein n=1 Tax=Panagrolaimus sp. JU765 TaxID=591449 RepID=A0AC34QW51_9BILA